MFCCTLQPTHGNSAALVTCPGKQIGEEGYSDDVSRQQTGEEGYSDNVSQQQTGEEGYTGDVSRQETGEEGYTGDVSRQLHPGTMPPSRSHVAGSSDQASQLAARHMTSRGGGGGGGGAPATVASSGQQLGATSL